MMISFNNKQLYSDGKIVFYRDECEIEVNLDDDDNIDIEKEQLSFNSSDSSSASSSSSSSSLLSSSSSSTSSSMSLITTATTTRNLIDTSSTSLTELIACLSAGIESKAKGYKRKYRPVNIIINIQRCVSLPEPRYRYAQGLPYSLLLLAPL